MSASLNCSKCTFRRNLDLDEPHGEGIKKEVRNNALSVNQCFLTRAEERMLEESG